MQTNKNNIRNIRWLTYLMFMMFAMTTDAVGVIIPELMSQFKLGMAEAGLVHYGPMAAIALSGLMLGFLADRFGRKFTIILGLGVFAIASFCFMFGDSFYFFLVLMVVAGVSIGMFRSAALALIGDISNSTKEHTSIVNGAEAFFGVGAIIGPLIVAALLEKGVDWKWLYMVAGILCLILISISGAVAYPQKKIVGAKSVSLASTMALLRDPYALGFSLGAFLYVAVECAVYVWMPTYLLGYDGSLVLLATYALSLFFILRALGRFLGMWLLSHLNWAAVIALCSTMITCCFIGSIWAGKSLAVILLPASGLFMSVIYPTLNSKGISCFARHHHGAVAGVILFFTAAGAAFGPLIMGVVSDANGGDAVYGFIVASGLAALLTLGLLANWIWSPVTRRLLQIEQAEYLPQTAYGEARSS